MQMSTLDSCQYSNNTTILCIWAWERFTPSVWKRLQKKDEKEKTILLWCSIFHWQKARNKARPPYIVKLRRKAILSVLDPMLDCFAQTEIACWNSISAVLNWGCSQPQGLRERTSWGANFSDNTKTIHQMVQKMIFPSGRGAGFKMNWEPLLYMLVRSARTVSVSNEPQT